MSKEALWYEMGAVKRYHQGGARRSRRFRTLYLQGPWPAEALRLTRLVWGNVKVLAVLCHLFCVGSTSSTFLASIRSSLPHGRETEKYGLFTVQYRPVLLGTASIAYRRDQHGGEITAYAPFFEPKDKVVGRISVFGSSEWIVNQAHPYLGQELCNEDPAAIQRMQNLLVAQRPAVPTNSPEGMNVRLINRDAITSCVLRV